MVIFYCIDLFASSSCSLKQKKFCLQAQLRYLTYAKQLVPIFSSLFNLVTTQGVVRHIEKWEGPLFHCLPENTCYGFPIARLFSSLVKNVQLHFEKPSTVVADASLMEPLYKPFKIESLIKSNFELKEIALFGK